MPQVDSLNDTLLAPTSNLLSYSPPEMLLNLALATVFGLILALIYRATHKGLSYSQSFTQTIVFVALIVSLVMMVISESVARAFALVGALSIIRFRTVVKDTKDTAYIFAALATGMAAGTSNYLLGAIGAGFVGLVAWYMNAMNFGALYKSEFILRFQFDKAGDSAAYLAPIEKLARSSHLLHVEPSGDAQSLKLTYDITLKEDVEAEHLARVMGEANHVSEVVLIASKSDVDY